MRWRIAILLVLLCCTSGYASGSPGFLPDGAHPRIILTPSELGKLSAKRDASATEWTALASWCDAHINDAGYDTQPTELGYGGVIAYGLANWDGNNTYFGYRMSGFVTHLKNYALAYQTLKQPGTGQDLAKASSYAARARTLLLSIAQNLNVGEEPNGLRAIRVSDLADTSVNSSEVTALKATTESLPGQASSIGYKLGYASRFLSAVPLAYDWIYDTLSQEDKDILAPMMLRWYDWIQGTRSTYNNGVLIGGIRYYEDAGGAADSTHINPSAGVITTASDYGKLYSNFGSGHESLMVLIPVVLYGYNSDIPAYLDQTKSRLTSSVLAQLGNDLKQSGGESVEGWNYGSGYSYLVPSLYGYYTATGDTSISGMAWFSDLVESMAHRLAANLVDVPYYGYWTGTPMGVNRSSFALPFVGVLQRVSPLSDMTRVGQSILSTTWPDTPALYDKLLWEQSGIEPLALSTLSLSHIAKGSGFFTSRSSWTSSTAVHLMAMLKGLGAEANHEGYSQGHFSISRGADRLLSHSNAAGDSPPAVSFNTIVFNNANHYANNPLLTTPAIDRKEEATSYSYVSGDITNAYKRQYNPDKALRFRRSLLHLRPGFVVVYDVTRSNSAVGNLKSWYSQYTASPTTTSDTISATVGASKVFVKTMYPANGTFTTTNPYTGSYRVSYVPAVTQEYDQFLHVIEATDSGASQTPPMLIDGTGARGVVIGGSTVAMFTKDRDGASASSLAYTVDTSTASTHYIADLVPGAEYTVSIDGAATATSTASEAGLIVFSSSLVSSHSYSVVQTGEAPPPDPSPATATFRGSLRGSLR